MTGVNPEQIYKMKEAEVAKAEQEYRIKKGKEYLRSSHSHQKLNSYLPRVKTEDIRIPSSLCQDEPSSPLLSKEKSRNYIRDIFKDAVAKKEFEKRKSELSLAKIRKLQERE